MPVISLFDNQVKVPEDNITLGKMLNDIISPATDLEPFEIFDGIPVRTDLNLSTPHVSLSSVIEKLLSATNDFQLTLKLPPPSQLTIEADQVIAPLAIIDGEGIYTFTKDTLPVSDIEDLVIKTFTNDDSEFEASVDLTIFNQESGGDIFFDEASNFIVDIIPVPDEPTVTVVDSTPGLPNQAEGIQYLGEFTITSNDASESLWFDIIGVPDGAEVFTLDEEGKAQFKFDPVPIDTSGGIEQGSYTKSINAPAAANSPQTIRVGIIYDGETLPDDLQLSVRGRSIEGEAIDEIGLEAATATSSPQPLNTVASPTQIAITFSSDAAINENSDSLLNLLANVEITGDYSDYPAIASPQNLAELLQDLESIGLPFSIELTPGSGTVKDSQNSELPKTNGTYLINETNSPLDDLTVELPGDDQVTVEVTIPNLNNNATGQTNDLTLGSATGEVDTLRVADQPILTVDINDNLAIDKNDPNPLVEIGDYKVQPGDDEEISLVVDAIPPNSSLVVLDDDGEVQATFTPTENGFSTNLNADTLQGTLAVQFNDPHSDLEDFNLNLFAKATEPGTNLTAFSDTFNLNIDLPDLIETGDHTETGNSNGTKQLLTYSPGKGAFTFENAKGAILGQELLDDGDGGLREVGFVITDGNPQDVLTDSKAVFSVLPDGTIIGNQERLTELTQDTGNIHFFKVNGGSIDDLIDGRLSSDTVEFNLEVTATDSGYILKWADGLEIGIGLNDKGQSPLALFQGQHESEILTNPSDEVINVSFNIKSWADYENTVGLFAVNDETGAVTDPLTGETVLPYENGYTEIALSHNLLFEGEAGESGTVALAPGTIYMPFIVADGSVSDGLEGEAQVYFPVIAANSDNFDHVRLLGDNIFAFEDLHGGGDMDFNDIIIEFT